MDLRRLAQSSKGEHAQQKEREEQKDSIRAGDEVLQEGRSRETGQNDFAAEIIPPRGRKRNAKSQDRNGTPIGSKSRGGKQLVGFRHRTIAP